MRPMVALVAFALLVPAPAIAGHGGVHIAEILPAPDEGGREFIELWNDGPPIDLTGWTIHDTAGSTYTFGDTTLATGARIVVWGGGSDDARGPAWSRAAVWNNGGDQAFLVDGAGATVDTFAYGTAGWPDGRAAAVPAAPATGRSLSLVDDTWRDTAPTPGSPTSTGQGSATATVANTPPEVVLAAPDAMRVGAVIDVTISIDDANGPDDIMAWRLTGGGTQLANGTAAGTHTVTITAPSDRDIWQLAVDAQDQAGHITNVAHNITLRATGLVVIMPAGGLTFPTFPPGASDVVTNASFVLRNDADQAITPRIDLSDLVGPATIPVAGRLDIGADTWTVYQGPLTPLPTLQPGEALDLRLRLRDIPTPLPAGTYGTSFTVIA